MNKEYKDFIVTKEYLKEHPNEIFVFGDNLIRKGKEGAAIHRDESNTYGFITKKYPHNRDSDFYKPGKYEDRYILEIWKLQKKIKANPDKIFLISKLGAGLANRFGIFEQVIEPHIKEILGQFSNVKFLW